jgi:hypothetical protein
MSRTQVFKVNPTILPANVSVVLPDPGGAQVKVPITATVIEAVLNLTDANKLSVGLSIQFQTFFSVDGVAWTLGNEFTWNSYGPAGLTVRDPDGTVRVNPDPRLQISVANHHGDFIHVTILCSSSVSAGATVSVF